MPGRVIVKFKSGVRQQGLSQLGVGASGLVRVRSMALPGAFVYRAPGISAAATLELAHELEQRPDVEYAEPDRRVQALSIPDDPGLSQQWSLQDPRLVEGATGIPGAWSMTTGDPGTVVAVVDTGILYRPGDAEGSHPDFAADRILPGYDFISDLETAGDGDGRDADPYDPGDELLSYHGSFVAGIIGANTNNGAGMAGLNWQARLLPVRVLGVGGGYDSDVIDGTLWAAGVSVTGVAENPTPADVINLSLGGPSTSCPALWQDAIKRALAGPRKPVIVVAAGNDGENASATTPANCAGVITVGASDQNGRRSSYSNYGPRIDVMAPGGDGSGGAGDIYSLTRSAGGFGYAPEAGTSFAAPHVAGVASLLRGWNASLTAGDILDILRSTGAARSDGQCDNGASAALHGSDCGAGLLNATAALQQAQAPSFYLSSAGKVKVSPGASGTTDISVNTRNGFSGAVAFSVQGRPAGVAVSVSPSTTGVTLRFDVDADVAPGQYNLTVTGTSGVLSKTTPLVLSVPSYTLSVPGGASLQAGSQVSLSIGVGRQYGFSDPVTLSLRGLPAGVTSSFSANPAAGSAVSLKLQAAAGTVPGNYALTLEGSSGALNRSAALSLRVGSSSSPAPSAPLTDVTGTHIFAVAVENGRVKPEQSAVTVITASGPQEPYEVQNLASGHYYVFAWQDTNQDGALNARDLAGFYTGSGTAPLTVSPVSSEVNVVLEDYVTLPDEEQALITRFPSTLLQLK